MQNWALQHVLRQMGHSPVTVDYWQMTNKRRRRMIWKHYKSLLFRRSKLASCPLPSKVEGWRADVRRFVRKNIRLTSPMDVVRQDFGKNIGLMFILWGATRCGVRYIITISAPSE